MIMGESGGATAPVPDTASELLRYRSTYINSFGRILSFGSVFEESIATELRGAELTAGREARHMSDDDLEAPEADVVEQGTDAVPGAHESDEDPPDVPLEADPADAVEQAREVGPDDDEDYR
jgi:hypothetical protein